MDEHSMQFVLKGFGKFGCILLNPVYTDINLSFNNALFFRKIEGYDICKGIVIEVLNVSLLK